jgi:hypothetical protein
VQRDDVVGWRMKDAIDEGGEPLKRHSHLVGEAVPVVRLLDGVAADVSENPFADFSRYAGAAKARIGRTVSSHGL